MSDVRIARKCTLVSRKRSLAAGLAAAAMLSLMASPSAWAADNTQASAHHARRQPPKVVLISLDGARPDLIERYIAEGVLPRFKGLGLLKRRGVFAEQNITVSPSLTAVSHIAIATGSTAVNNDIPANFFNPIVNPITQGISGFGAAIGGYRAQPDPVGPSAFPTAQPLWVRLRDAGRSVSTATWPGGDGINVRIINNTTLVQSAEPTRTVNFTVPFGAGGGLRAAGFSKTAADFEANAGVTDQLTAVGVVSYSPALTTKVPFETFHCASTTAGTCGTTASATLDVPFEMMAAAIDSTDDGVVNYDEMVFFNQVTGIQAGPFYPPSTGPAYVMEGGPSKPFFFEGTGNVIGTAFFVSFMADDLSAVRFARYAANYIPRTSPVAEVIANVDDINSTVGFWRPQPDFNIPQGTAAGMSTFPEVEREAMYEDQGETFIPYQTDIGLRAFDANPDADLVMIYIEEPDGSGHQFTLTDPRQASNPKEASSLGANQNPEKVARYDRYLKRSYQLADIAVDRIIQRVGLTPLGIPRRNIVVVSDHGMAPFHSAVSLANLLKTGLTPQQLNKLAIRTSGPAANIYVDLAGRQEPDPNKTNADPTYQQATAQEYQDLVNQVAFILRNAVDPNFAFNYTLPNGRLFDQVSTRPFTCQEGLGYCTSPEIGQDSGDVFAIMALGYNYDGIQNPGVARLGDPPYNSATTVFSVPSFYGAHGYLPALPIMSATFIAAGPNFKRNETVEQVRNIDVAPTISWILNVPPSNTVDGEVLTDILR